MSVFAPPFVLPIFKGGAYIASEVIVAADLRQNLHFDGDTFCTAKCRNLQEAERVWVFSIDDDAPFCSVTWPSVGEPDASGWYLATVSFPGDPFDYVDGQLFQLTASALVDSLGEDYSLSVFGTRVSA